MNQASPACGQRRISKENADSEDEAVRAAIIRWHPPLVMMASCLALALRRGDIFIILLAAKRAIVSRRRIIVAP